MGEDYCLEEEWSKEGEDAEYENWSIEEEEEVPVLKKEPRSVLVDIISTGRVSTKSEKLEYDYDDGNDNNNDNNNARDGEDRFDYDTFDVDAVLLVNPRYGNTDDDETTFDSKSEESYSFCGGSSIQTEESYSLIGDDTSAAYQSFNESDTINSPTPSSSSNSSSLWDFVSKTIDITPNSSSSSSSHTSNNQEYLKVISDNIDNTSVFVVTAANGKDDSASTSCLSSSLSDFLPPPGRVIHSKEATSAPAPAPPRLFVPKKCAICLEGKNDVVRLMHKCHHPEACMECLQTLYIQHGLFSHDNKNDSDENNDGNKNHKLFPLRCFWPGCERTLRDTQIRSLLRTNPDSEKKKKMIMDRYYRLEDQAKQIRKEENRLRREVEFQQQLNHRRVQNFRVVQKCSHCDQANVVYPGRSTTFVCVHGCSEQSNNPNQLTNKANKEESPQQPITVLSLSEVESIVETFGDSMVYCPACKELIVKQGGCDHMTCICGNEFSFTTEQAHLQRFCVPIV